MRCLIFLFFIMCVLSATDAYSSVIKKDTAMVQRRSIPAVQMEKYRGDRDFQYARDQVEDVSLWGRFWRWLWDLYYSLFGHDAGNRILKIAMWLMVISTLTFFLIRILGMDVMNIFSKKNYTDDLSYKMQEEDIHETDFESEISEAVQQNQFRLATRLLYLQCLKSLADRNLIHWQAGKTNQRYLNELKDATVSAPFHELTRYYEYIWYGESPVAPQQFNVIRSSFDRFRKQL